MRQDPRRDLERRVRLVLIILFVPATGATLLSYSSFIHFLAPYGLDTWTRFIAAVPAVVNGVMYEVGFSLIIGRVAFLPRQDRARVMPVIWVMTLFILAASAYPNVEFMAGGYANDFEDRNYVEMVVAKAEENAAQIEKLGAQLEPVLQEPATMFRGKARGERNGETSGISSDAGREGPVAGWIDSYAARFENLAATVKAGREKAAAIKPRITSAATNMRGALNKSAGDLTARRAAMQTVADELRSAVIELTQTIPTVSLTNFAASLKGAQVKPSLAANENTRARQEAAIAGIAGELKSRGEQIEQTLANLTTADEGLIPPYMPSPTPVLVIKHALKLVNVIAAALAIDLLPLAIFLIIARVNDALRRVPDDTVKSLTVEELIDAEKAKAMLKAEQARREQGLIEKSPKTRWLDRGDDGRDAR